MAKVTGPLFSLDARGKIADTLVYAIWKGTAGLRLHRLSCRLPNSGIGPGGSGRPPHHRRVVRGFSTCSSLLDLYRDDKIGLFSYSDNS
jgi:hypothetical protein